MSSQSAPTGSRFVALDGLRGIAALVVVVWHSGATRFIPNGYLAVDLFFCLSGFVLAHAYEGQALGWPSFMLKRLIRLYPLYALGTAIGALCWLTYQSADFRFWSALGFGTFMLPTPTEWGGPYLLDGPAWSLFFELLLNAAWFALVPRLSTRLLLVVVALAAVALVGLVVINGSLDTGGPKIYLLSPARAAFPFFCGVLCYRVWRKYGQGLTLPIWIAPLLFLAVISLPFPHAIIDSISSLVLIPVAIFCGACAATHKIAKQLTFLGDASYAVYTLHSPLIYVVGLYLARAMPTLGYRDYIVAAIGAPAVLVLAGFADTLYDRRARSFLTSLVRSAQRPRRLTASAGDESSPVGERPHA